MKYILAIIFFGLIVCLPLKTAEPVIEVGDLPNDEVLEFYEESEELFSLKLLEYYDKAVALRTQIILLGAKPKTKFNPPSYEEMSDQDLDLIKKYHKLARQLENEVLSLPEDYSHKQINELRKELVSERKKFDSLFYEEKAEHLEANYNLYFKDRVEDCVKSNIHKNFIIDSLKFDCLVKLEKQREQINKYFEDFYENTYPAVSLSATANKLFYNSTDVQEKLSFNAELLFNLNPLFKYGKYFDIWLSYMMPVFETKSFNPANPEFPIYQRWNADVYSIGLNGNVPTMFKFDKLKVGMKMGLGYFWGLGRMYNIGLNDAKYAGQLVRFELNFGKKSVFAPFEVFISYSTYFHSQDFILETPTDLFNLGKTNINSLSLGFRMGIIRTNSLD